MSISPAERRDETALARAIAFSSDNLPSGINDRRRFAAWRAFLGRACGPLDVSRRADRPFSQQMGQTRFEEIAVVRLRGTMDRISWNPRLRANRPPAFFLCLSRAPMWFSQSGRAADFDAETAGLGSCVEGGEIRWSGGNDLSLVVVPQARLLELMVNTEDLLARPLPSRRPALQLLRRYLEIVPAADEIEANPDMATHVARTLTDLVVLALGVEGEIAEIARPRGMRAARLQQILAEIRTGFADPAFSETRLAKKLGITTRYIQALLQETGLSFTERVVELRLQRARAMLADPRSDRMRVADVAAACGFNEVPYFNRRFRRRFGTTPTQSRGSGP